METKQSNISKSLLNIEELVNTLRGKNGCPWDIKQTPQTMIMYMIEEVYELLDAIESSATHEIMEELGDVLFHIFFIANIYQDKDDFNISDVANTLYEKMVRRHPHVFGDLSLKTSEEVLINWDKIKKQEKKQNQVLDNLPKKMPALLKAHKLFDKKSQTVKQNNIFEKIQNEVFNIFKNFTDAVIQKDKSLIESTAGMLILFIIKICSAFHIHPEIALNNAVNQYVKSGKSNE